MNTTTPSSTTAILQSLSEVAEKSGDIAPYIYKAYFQRCPGSEALMSHIDDLVKGRMMAEVFKLLMAEDLPKLGRYLRFETKTHKGYGAEPQMYENLLISVRDTVKKSLGAGWRDEYEQAWQARLQELLHEITIASGEDSQAR